MTMQRWWRVQCETGPDAGSTWMVPAGRYVVGRAPQADMRCADPALEPFHAVLDLTGEVGVAEQIAGRLPIVLPSCPSSGGDDRDAGSADVLGPDRRWFVLAGRSVLSMAQTSPAALAPPPDHSGPRRPIVRSARFVPDWSPPPVHVPLSPQPPVPPSGGAGPVIVAAVTTAAMTLVLRQPMFLVLGAIGTTVAAATWATAWLRHRRRCREHQRVVDRDRARFDDDLAAQRTAFVAHVRRTVPTLCRALARLDRTDAPWQRRPAHTDAWRVSLGLGTVPWRPVVAQDGASEPTFDRLTSAAATELLPVAVELGPGTALGISGPAAAGLARALVLQLAAMTGPADWQLVVVTASLDRWSWTRHLPHAHDRAGRHLVVDDDGLGAIVRDDTLSPRHTVVVTDAAAVLSVRTSNLRRWVNGHPSLALVVLHDGALPALCTTSVVTMSDGRARAAIDGPDEASRMVHVAAVSASSADDWAMRLRTLRDPEDDRGADDEIPTSVTLSDLLDQTGLDPLDASSIARAWASADVDAPPRAPLGRAADGVVEVDLVRDGPHGLLAGTTGAGKSELLRSLVAGLAVAMRPDQLTFVLVDYKGGAAFDDLSGLPHVVGTVTDLDDRLAERALVSLRAELTHREHLLRSHGAGDLSALRSAAEATVVPRILVVVDEFAALAVEQADFLHALVEVAQRGRSLGVHLLLATQRPSGVISDDIRANTNLRVALRLHDTADAIDVVGDPSPASLQRSRPGRAVMRLGPDELVMFQTARVERAGDLVAAVRLAATHLGVESPRRVWCDPLPDHLERATTADPDEIGLIDRPERQCHDVLRWSPADGGAVVVGALGTGVTSTLRSLSMAALDAPGGRGVVELVVIDAGNDPSWAALAVHPKCVGLVRLHERERLWRSLARLAVDAEPGVRRALVIDGFAALRVELEAIERAAERDLLDRIVTDSSVVLLVGADRAAGVPPAVASRCALRLVLHVHDRHDAALLGVPPASVPPMVAGRAALAPDGAAVQIAAPRLVRVAGRRRDVTVVRELPSTVVAHELPEPELLSDGWRVPIGVGFDDLAPHSLRVGWGEHLLIAGAARSGRSSALALMGSAWRRVHREETVVVVAPPRSPVADELDVIAHREMGDALDAVDEATVFGDRVLLLVDDAELIDDPAGRLSSIVASRDPRLLVVAAGRPDALRQAYGHWTAAVRRSRSGLLAVGAADIDGDLLGATLPRRPLLAPRPGLVYVVDGGAITMVQLARPCATGAGDDATLDRREAVS